MDRNKWAHDMVFGAVDKTEIVRKVISMRDEMDILEATVRLLKKRIALLEYGEVNQKLFAIAFYVRRKKTAFNLISIENKIESGFGVAGSEKEKEEDSLAGHLQRHPASDGWEGHAVCVTEIDLDMIRKLTK